MIEQIHVKNFESHKDSVFDLSPGVNVIVGDSHVGKSAIRRFLHWINVNRPLGDSYVKQGEKRAYGRVQFDNGAVERTKTSKKSTYTLDSESDSFESFGSGVPEKVTELVNMSDVNFQTQHGSFFLLQDTPGSVASYLRSVTGLDDLTSVATDITTRLRSAKSNLTTQMQLVGEMEQELEELCQLDICRLEECIGEYKEFEARNKKVVSEISSLDRAVKRLKELDEIASISEDEARQLFERADSLINKDELLGSQAFRLEVSLDKLADLDVGTVDVPVGILDGVEEIIQAHAKNLDRFENLDDLIGRWNGISKVELVDVGRLDGLREEEQILLSQLVECPHCGTELTEESRAVLIGESR